MLLEPAILDVATNLMGIPENILVFQVFWNICGGYIIYFEERIGPTLEELGEINPFIVVARRLCASVYTTSIALVMLNLE